MSRTASQWNVSVAAPDLSNVLKTASRIGSNQAYAEFYENLTKQAEERAQARKEDEAERESAARDLGNEPESEGFWNRLGQEALGGLEWTLDKLSRPNYAVANMFSHLEDQDEKADNAGLSFWERTKADLADIPNALQEFGEGFSGKDKTTFAQVLAKSGSNDPAEQWRDNKVFQGVAGFGMDVLLDPTTYLGVGIVTKPMKKVSEEVLNVKAASLSRDIAKLGGDPAPGQVNVNERMIYNILTGKNITSPSVGKNTSRRAANMARTATKTERVRQYIDNIDTLKKEMRKDPTIDNARIKELDEAIDDIKVRHVKALDDYGKNAYREALKRFDTSTVSKASVDTNLLDLSDRAVPLGKIAKAFEKAAFAGKGLTKEARKAEARKAFDEALGPGWMQDTRLTPEQRDEILHIVDRVVKHDKQYQSLFKRIQATSANVEAGAVSNSAALDAGNLDVAKNISKRIPKDAGARRRYYWKQHLIRAHAFANIVQHMTKDKKFLDRFKDLDSILDRKADIEKKLESLAFDAPSHTIVKTSQDINQEGVFRLDQESSLDNPSKVSDAPDQGESMVTDEVRELQQELMELNKWVDEGIYGDRPVVPNPEGIDKSFKLTEDWLKGSSEFQSIARNAVEERADEIYHSKVETYKRDLREKSLAEAESAGDYHRGIPVGYPEKTYLRRSDMVSHTIHHPDDLAIGFGWKIPYKGKLGVTWADAKRLGVTPAEWKKVFRDWVKLNKDKPGFERTVKDQYDAMLYKRKQEALTKGKSRDRDVRIPQSEVSKMEKAARAEAILDIQSDIRRGRLKHIPDRQVEFFKGLRPEDIEMRHSVAVDNARRETALKIQAAKLENPRANSKPAQLKAEIKRLEDQRDATIKALDEAYEEAKKTRHAMAERLDEQFIIDMLADPVTLGRKGVELRFAGKAAPFIIPAPKVLTAATEKLGGIEILQKAHNAWAEAFRPASKLSPELNEARLRMQGRVNDILKHHLDEVFHAFSKFKPEQQATALKSIKNGAPVGNTELFNVTKKFLDDFLYYTGGHASVGGKVLTLDHLNRYLPDEFKFLDPDGRSVRSTEIHTAAELLESMRRLKPDTDAMKVIWSLRIAAEKGMAELGMRHVVAKSYGIKRILKLDETNPDQDIFERRDLIEALKEKHNWTTIDGFGEEYYFPPDAAEDIDKLLNMMKPERTQEVMHLYDKALRAWKSTVTVYNLGYYTRNAIGEVIMGLFDGVSDPKWYYKAGSVLKFAMPDEVEDTLKSLTPWKKFQTEAQAGSRRVVKLKHGKHLSAEEVWVLYHEYNLKSGFISTEYDHYFPAANRLRATPVGQVATRINDKVRTAGEKFEDYFRLAHFMNRMARSSHRTIEGAAQEAAEYVRKYHFDYTDFTPFEKTKMMRAFPFYKWTRKAFPLMAGMIFSNPGKVMLYPKAMQNASYASGGTDPLADNNGFFPNYEDMTPEWMKSLMAYPMGTPDAEGAQTYMNVATPAFDIYKMMNNPVSATIGMLSPLGKVPAEQAMGETLDPGFKLDVKTGEQRKEHLMRTTPLGSLINNIQKGSQPGEDSAVTEEGALLDERLVSFLSGLGFYENNEKRQQGEQLRRNLEGK